MTEAEVSQEEIWRYSTADLRGEEGATAMECKWPRAGRGKETKVSPGEGTQLQWHLDFNSVRPI